MIFDKLQKTKNLTNTEEIIASFILNFPRIVVNISLEELSEQCHVSQASIIRLCKKFGVKGFSEFKVKLASELTSFALDGKMLSVDLPIPEGSSTEDIADTFYYLSMQSLEYEYKALNIADVKRAAQLIHNADITYIYGRGESLIIAEDLHYKLIRLGLTSVLESMNGFQEAQSFTIDKHSTISKVAIVISQYSNSHQVHYIIDELVTNNIPFILLTASKDSWPFDKLAKVTLRVHSTESRYKMGSFTSRNAMLYVLDCVFGELFNINYEKNRDNLFSFAKRKTERDYYYRKNDHI
ncbi:MurR/RpiR family transcriptional regulator [Enterococcus hulanensis]|uniref:MurR/RpiR family transcriptional regulator n=1 Tax=Enterococcus hulanensis TaxID=2559929 RepID=UPI001A8E01B9|nr:MurR/RpiR family transcriptional regulator [Enterococcus hulanensis]MBO0458155.1 MurR/RpiR family transcriptional regulator [Enterococcus hulanensis]